MAENVKVTEACKKYWAAVLEVLDAAGDYSQAIKLYANLMDETTRWKVEPIFEEYYEGKISKLRDAIAYREHQFIAKIDKLNLLCKQHGLRTVTKPKKLLDLLLDPNRRRSYREKSTRRLKNGKICAMQDFEMKK